MVIANLLILIYAKCINHCKLDEKNIIENKQIQMPKVNFKKNTVE